MCEVYERASALSGSQKVSNLWERQSGETAKAFHAFEHLRTLSALDRSIPEARLACRAQCGISPASVRQWHGWSTKFQWFNRAAEHDSDLASRRRERRAKELERAQDNAVTLARAALAKVAEKIQRLDVEEMQVGQIPSALKTLIELEFKALGHEDKVALKHEGKIEVDWSADAAWVEDYVRQLRERSVDDAQPEG